MNKLKQNPFILETNVFYLVIAIVFLTLGAYAQRIDIYTGLVVTEYIIVLLPTILYLKIRGYSLKKVLRLNPITFKQTIIIPAIVILSYPVGMFVNSLMMIVLSFFGEIKAPPIPIPETGSEFLVSFAVVAISAGICEEIMFRGMVMNSYERLGKRKAIIYSAILFGVFHFNIQNLLGPIFLGLLFGYMVYKTNSIYAGMLAHMANNLIATVLSVGLVKLQEFGSLQMDPTAARDITATIPYPLQMTIGAFSVGFIAVITGTGAYFLLKALPRTIETAEAGSNEPTRTEKMSKISLIPLLLSGVIFIGLAVLTIRNM